jgi:hypothetical protein
MTTLLNTTLRDIISKTSFNYGSLEADLMLTSMNCGYGFIKAYVMAKSIQRANRDKFICTLLPF